MKLLRIACILLLLSCCKDDDDQTNNTIQNPVDALPELTHEGKNTIGCLVNGEVFLPKGHIIQGNKIANYTSFKYFQIQMAIKEAPILRSVFIQFSTEVKGLEVGRKYELNAISPDINSGWGEYSYSDSTPENNYYNSYDTTNEFTGELIINHIDYSNYTVSGTFWFDAKLEGSTEVVEIREGRFDMEFLN
ncbi:DUF6252 family protein [Aureivirga marina]|uniref:DUF6252 family protein n=1 Tax=Aureivirga marina TaxID=1182451 RepID=UPI0018C9C1D3|nr:DUF6252 family protein [Aureivirga marina]